METKNITVPIGNINLLNHERKTAFLSSRNMPDYCRPAITQWLDTLNADEDCVMCGDLQKTEHKVILGLVKRGIPTILVLGEPYPKKWPTGIVEAIGDQRLLALTTTDFLLPWVDKFGMADARNRYMIANASKIVVGFCRPDGQLAKQLKDVEAEVTLLNEYDPTKEPPAHKR
ncbi:MAG: hypothetical protein ACI35N_06800 [Marinilabiliaceae bacterium]|mgnify:CR=1 FL=1